MLPNWESGPQNQPKAKVAVWILAGADLSMGGTNPLGFVFVAIMVIFSFVAGAGSA